MQRRRFLQHTLTAAGSIALADIEALALAMRDGSLLQGTAFTLAAAALGLLMGSLPGIAIGTVLGLSRRAAAAMPGTL